MILNDINNYVFKQENKPSNMVLRQMQVTVEYKIVSGSKRMQPYLRLQFDTRVRNVNRQIGECDDNVGLECWHVLWKGKREGEGIEMKVRNNTTMKINYILPELRLGDQDWSHFKADLLDLVADLAVCVVAAF